MTPDDMSAEVWAAVAATCTDPEQVLTMLATLDREELVTFASLSLVALLGECLRATGGDMDAAQQYARAQVDKHHA